MSDNNERLHIDGDRLIAFVNGVKNLGVILEELNIAEFFEAFKMHSKIGAFDALVEHEKAAVAVLGMVKNDLHAKLAGIDEKKRELHQLIQLAKSASSPDAVAGLKVIKEFSDVLDNIAKHRESGLLESVATLAKQTTKR